MGERGGPAYRRSEWVLAFAAGLLIAGRSQALFPGAALRAIKPLPTPRVKRLDQPRAR